MEQIAVEFNYEGRSVEIQGMSNEKMKNIYQRFASKSGIDLDEKKLLFSYNGKWEDTSKISENLTFNQMANSEDKDRKKMSILVAEDTFGSAQNEENNQIRSNEIVCPVCCKNCLIKFENYRISLYGCENGHVKKNILLNQFKNTQHLETENIFCSECQKKRSEIFQNTIHKCLTCKKKLCPICRSNHAASHEIIDYEDLNYICEEDNDNFVGYCEECGKQYCMTCEENHDEHQKIYFRNMLPKKKDLQNSLANLKTCIDDFKEQCDEIINVIDNVKKNLDILYKIKEECISRFNLKKKNYFQLNNLDEMKHNEEIMNDINLIKKEISIEKKFNHIVNIYNNMNNMYNIYKMNTSELQFAVIKDELRSMIDDIIRQFLNDKDYEKDQAQNWCNCISDEIIKVLNQLKRGFKFVCTCTIFQKGDASMNFSSTCLWKPNQDGSITVKYENNRMHCFVCLFGLALDNEDNINSVRNNIQFDIYLAKENEELRRKCNFLQDSLDEMKKSREICDENKKKYELIKFITFAGIDKKTKMCKYDMANKCLLIELILSGYDSTQYITSERVANTMLDVDRGDFAPQEHYLDKPTSIGYNVNISAPHMHAFALEYLAPYCTKGARILDIGSGSGYLTVALSRMTNYSGVVVGVEHIPELYNFGIENVKKHHGNLLNENKIIFVNEDGRKGCKKYGPYKAIHVGAASEKLPQDIIDQLDYNGRMFIPIGPERGSQNIYIIDKDINGKVTYRAILSVGYSMLRDKESQLKKPQN